MYILNYTMNIMSSTMERRTGLAGGHKGHCTLEEQDLKSPFHKAVNSLNDSLHSQPFQNAIIRLKDAAEGILLGTALLRLSSATPKESGWPERYREFKEAQHNAIESLCAKNRLPEARAIIEEIEKTGKVSMESLLDSKLSEKIEKQGLGAVYNLLVMPKGGLAKLEEHIATVEVTKGHELRNLEPRRPYPSSKNKGGSTPPKQAELPL